MWIKNPYKVTLTIFFGIYFVLSCFSWIRWHDYSSENFRLQQIEAKYEVDKAIIQDLNPQLSVTLSGYDKLTEYLGKEETLEFFKNEINKIKHSINTSRQQLFITVKFYVIKHVFYPYKAFYV